MTSIGNATPLVCVVVLLLALVVPPAAQQGDGCPPCDCSQNTVSVGVLIGACVAVLVGTLIIEALAILCYRKYCRDREKPQKVAHRFMVSPDEELVVKENLAYESDSDAQERSLREAKEKKRASIFSISETKDNMLYVPALYRNPITKDRDTGNAIMNGYHDYEPDYGVDSMFTYNAGWGSRVPNILSGKGNTNSLESLYMDADEYPILQTPQGVGHVNFTSSKYRDGFGRKSIDIHEDDGEVTTYTYTTGFGGKVRREVATVTTDPGDEMEIKGDRVTWRKLRAPDEVVLDMDEEEAKPETRISIDDNFTIGKPTSTKRQQYTEAEIHSDSPGTSYDPSGNFILRATPSTSRSDSSDDDLYDYGDSIEGQQHFQNMQKHSEPGKIGHGTFRATVGGIPLDHGSSEEETPTELFNSRYRYSTGLNKAKLIAMRAAAAAHAREQILHEEGPTEDQDDKTPVIGYIKLVKPDSDTDGSSEGQEYRVMPTRDPDSPNTVRLYPVNSTGQPITIQTHAPGGFSQDSYIRHRRETYIEVADAGLQCGMSPKGDRPGISQPGVTQERTSILKDRTSYNLEMNTVDDIPTIGVIRLMHPKSSKHVRIREDQTESSTITFSEEDLTSASLEDVTYRSTSRSTDRSSPRPRRARSAPARSEHAHIPEDDRHPFKEVPTIGVIRLVRQDTASESSGVESEIASGEDSAPEDRPRGQKTDKWTQHEVPIVRLAQQILQESVHERASSRQSQSRFDQDTDNIPTIGVVRLVRPRSTVSDVRPMTGSRTEEYFETTEETTQQVATPRDTPVSDMPTIGIIKLLKPNSRREPTTRIPVSVVDRGTQPANTWAQLLREMHSMVESEILRKTSRKQQHDQSTDETDALPRTISIIKLKREEEQVQHQVPFSQMDRSTQSSAEMRDEETMPTFTWSHLIHEVEDQIESRYKRMSAPTPKDNFEVSKSVQKLGIIQLKAAPEKIIRDSFTQISGPHTYEKSTGPAWSFQELVEEVEEEAVQKFKRTLKQLDRPAEQQDLHEPVRSVSVIKLKKEPAQEKLVRDSVTQISGPHMYEKSTGPVKTFEEIREEIEEEALREFKRTLSLLNRPAVFQEVSEPVQAVSVIKLKKGPEAQKPTVINRGVQPDLPWRELKEEIEDEAIEEYKKHMRRFQPKEVVQQVPTTQAPSVSVIKLKGPKTMPAPEKWDNITQCDLIKPKPLMTDQVTEPTRPWSDVLHNVRRILENEYRRTITELETRLMSSPKDEPAAEAVVPTVAVFKLKGPDVQPEPEKPTMVSEKTQAAPHTAEQETAPDRPWTSILTDVRKILENEYRRTIRELEDQLNGRDETDSGKTMAYFKLSTPEIPKVQTVSMYTQIDAPHTGEQGTVPERPWGQVVKDIRSSVENEYRVTIRELESQLAERPKEGPKGPTRLGIFKLKGPKQMKVKKPVVHDTFTEPTKPWLTLLSDIEENVERRLSLKAVKPIAVEPEIVQQTQQIVEMALQKKPATADTMTQASQATTSSKASQSAVVRSSSVSTEANIQPQVTEQSTSCDLRPSVNEDVQVEPTTAIKYTVTEATESSDFFQIFKPELSSQETQASPSKTTTATTPQKSSLQEAGIQTCPSTKDRDILTDPSPASDFGVQVEPLHEIPHIAPTIVQPVHAPITFKEPELEKIDVTVQVVPEKNSKASSTETKKYVETFVQVGSPQPNQETFGAQVQPDVTDGHSSVVIRMKDAGTDNRQVKSTDKSTETTNVKEVRDFAILVKPDVKNRVAATNVKKFLDAFAQVDEPTQEQAETDESSVQAVPSINVTFTSMDTPKLTDAFTQLTPLTVEQGDKFIQVNAHVADVGTGTPVVNYADNSSQVAMSTLSRQVQAHALLTDASTGKELPTTETSTQSVSVAKQEVSVQVTMEIETEPAIVKAVVQGEQYSMPSLSTPPDVTDSAMQTAPQTVEFSGQVKPQTLEKFTEKKIDGSNFGLQVSQNSTDSFTQPLDILSKTVPVQVRPRTVDKATEYSESKAYCIDIGMQYIIESNEIGVSVEPEMIEDGTAMEIKLQLDVGTQADCEITVEPAIIQEVLRAPEESVALMNRNVQTSNVDTQTVPEETKHQGTSPEGMKTSDAVVQHVELTNLRDSSVQADPLVTSTGTLAVTTAYSVHAAQVKPQTTDRGMTTVIRGSNERSSMANLFPKPYVKPPCKDAFAQIQPASNLTSEGTLTDQTAVKAMSVQASPATSTQGQTSKPEVREQWSMTDKTLEKNVIELIIPQVEEPVVASIPILKAELLDKTTQMLSPSQRDAFSSTEISQTQTATQYDINNDDLSTQTDVQLDVTNSSTQMEFLVIDTTVQTLPVKRETVSLSTDVTQFKTSFAQYEPDLFRSSVSNQTAVHTSSTGFSPEKIVLKSTGISPEKANVRTSSTQYQKTVLQDHSIQTEEQEQPKVFGEEIVTVEEIEVLESAPVLPEMEMSNTETQTENEVQPIMSDVASQHEPNIKTSVVQTIHVKLESKSTSTTGPQVQESIVQYEPERFRTAVASQTSIPTSTTGSSTEKATLKTTGVSPDKTDVKASSTQYQMAVTKDNSMQTEEQEESIKFEEFITVEQAPVVEIMPVSIPVELVDAETQAELVTTDRAILTEPEKQKVMKTSDVQTTQLKLESKFTSTLGPQLKESVVQYEPERFRTAVSSQTSIPTRHTSSSTEKLSLKTTGVSPEKADVKASSTQYQMAVTKDNSMQTEEEEEESIQIEEFITVEQAPVVEIMPASIPVELVDAETQAELITTDRAILTEPEKQKVMKTSDVQTTQLKLESKLTSTLGPQLKESVVQYEPERFRTAVSSQTSIPTRHTASSTEKLSLKTTGVSPEKADVKASSTQYQMAVTKDNSMQTEEQEESIQIEEFITVEQAPVVEIMPVSFPVELVDAETQAELITTDRAILTEPEKQKVMKTSDVQTTQLKLESKFTSTLGPQLKESVVQYEPERFRTAVSSQTSIPTRHTSSSTEKLSLKTTGVSPEKADVTASSTQYQMAVTKDNSMQTEEEEEESIQIEEFITVEQAPVVEIMPASIPVELVDAETQAELITTDRAILTEPEKQKVMKTSDVQTTQLKLESKFTSTLGPQLKESVVQYEPERFRTAVSSQTSIPTRHTASSTEKLSLKTIGVSPEKADVKASSTQYQMAVTKDSSMQTEEHEEPIQLDEFITVEQAPVIEFMPEFSSVELVDSETQAEPIMTDQAILTRPDQQEKTTATLVRKYTQAYVQNVPKMASVGQQMTMHRPQLVSQGTTTLKIHLTTKPTQAQPSTMSFSQMMEPTVRDHWSMTDDEPVKEIIAPQIDSVVESTPQLPVETQNADVQVEPKISSVAIEALKETAERGILVLPETREVTSQMSVHHATAYAQATVRHATISSQTDVEEKVRMKNSGIQTQQYLVTSRSYVPLKEKNYKPIEHAGDLVGIQPRGPLRTEHKTMQASISTANTSSQYTGLEQTATGFQTEETVEVSDMEVQTNPVTIIDFVPVLKDSFVQYEPMYFYSTSTQVEIPTMHQHVSAVVQNRTQETTTPIIRVQPSSSQTVAHHGKDNASQTNPMPEPEPLIAPMRTEPVLFAPPPLLPETQVAESQTDNVVLTDQSTSMQLPKVFSAYAQVGPRMQDTDTMTPVKLYAQIAVQNEPETLSQVMQTSPDVKEGTTLTENPDITHQASQYETAFVHVSSQAAPQSHDASTSSDLVFQEMIEAGTQHIMESNNFESQTSPDTREQASFTAFEMQESDCQTELTIEDLEEMLATLKKKLEEKPTVQEIIIPDKVNPVESPLSFLVDTEESGIQTFLETIQRSTSPILQEVKHVITQYEAELKDLGVQVKPDVIDKEMETFVVNVHDAAIQYASLYGKDKPTQFTPEVNDAGSITDQTEYQHNSTNTWSISLASKTMQACPKSMDKGTTPVLQQYDKRGTQTSGPETISRWTQREILWADVPIQVRPVLDDATSQTEYIIKEEIQALMKPIEKREVRLEMRSFKETNTAEIQTDPVIIKSAEPDDEKESWLDSGIDTDVQTDPVTILSDFDSEIELMDEDSQTCPVDMIDADIQVESRKEVNDTPSQTFQHLIAKTVQTEPKQVSYAGTVTTTRTVRPISSQTFPTKTENKGFQFEPVPYLTNEDIYTQTPVKLTKEQGTRALESQVKTSTTQTDEMPVIEPEIIHVANLQPVESQMVFSAPEAEVTDTGVQASAEVIHEDSQTTRVFTTDRPSSPGISYAVAESQTVTPVRRTRDTQYESNAAPKKTQTESTVTVNMSTATDQTISQDVCLQTFLETKPEIVDRSMQHVAVVLMGYSQTEETELQHGETQTDEVEEIQFITPSPEAVEAFAQTIDDVISVGAQTEGPDIMQSGTDAPVKRLKVGTTQTLRKNTWNEGTVTEPMKSMSMSVQTDGIPVRVVDEHISPIHLQPVHAPLTLPQYKPKLLDASIQADVKTDDRSMQHDSEATQFNIYSTRVVKGEVTPTVRSEYSMMPQKKHFISHLESTAYPEEEKLTNKHFVDTPTQVKPQVNNVPVQVQPGHDDCSTATEEAILTSTEVQTDFAEEPMEEIIRVSQVPVQQTPFLDLGPILMDTGTQVEPRTTDHGMSATDPQFEGPSYLELGPMLLDTGTQARPTVSDHGMLTMMPLEPLPAWTQTELKTEDTAAQHEIYVQNAINQTFTHQKEHSTYTSIDVRQESSQATTEKKDAGVQAKTVEEVSVMTTGIQTVVIREEKPQMMDVGMQFRPLKIDQTTWTSKARTVSSHSNTEPMNMKQAMVQVAIKPQTQARATLTIPKHSRNITTQAEMKCYDACVQHDDLPDLADKGLQIKPVMVDDISETTQSRQIDQPIQVNLDGTKPSTIDVSIQHAEEKDTQDKIAQVKPISAEAGVWTEFDTKDKGNQADLPPEIDDFVHPVVTKIQHAPIPFPETMTTDRSIQHQPSYDSQTVQTSIDVAERASSPVGPVYNDGSSQTQADTCDMGFQTTSQETSTAEVQAVMSYFSEESFRMESVKEDFISAQVFTEEQHVAPLPTVQYQDAQMQYNPVTEDSTTETVSTGIDSANQSQPLTIDQATTTEITKHSQVEIQVDIGNPSVITHETAVQHDMVFKPVDAFTQIHPLTVDEGTSTVPLQRTEVSVQYIAPTDKRPSSPRVVPQTNDKGTSAQYDTSQSSTQTILLKSDVGIQSKPNTKSELTHAAIKPESHDQSTTTRPNVRAFETQTFLPKKNEGSQCDYATLVHNTSQYEKLFVADNSVQVKPVIREQANSPIFKRKEVGNASSQTDAVPGELDSSIGDLVKYVPHQPFKPNVESDFMHDYSDRLCEYLAHDEQVPVFVEHPIERIKTSSQFQPRQESSSPVWDYSEDFSSRLYDAEMTESIDIIDKLFTSDQRTFEMEEPITKDETNQAMSAPKYYIDSAVQTGDIRTKERSTSPLFPPMKEAESQFDAQIGHADTNVQAGPITASESCYTDHVSNKDVSSQADFATNEVLTSDAATQHYTLGQNISAQVEPLMMDAGMTWKVDSTPISTQAKPETLEQGTSTPKQSTPTSDMQTQAKPASVAKNTSPLTIRKNQVAVQAQVDRHHIPTQYERVSSTDAIVQMSPESREKGTSTKPENKDVSIYVIPTQRHETTQYEQSVRTVDFMVQYRAQHLDSSTQSVDFKPACLDRASSPIHIAFEEIQKDKMPITESPIQPAVIQQVSASPTQLEPFNQLDSSYLRQEIRDEIRIEVMHEIREELREELLNEVQHNFNSQIETQVHDELRTELEITLREEIREEFIEEYKEEIMMEIKEELKVEFESRIRHEFEERTRDDLEFKIRREIEPKVRRDLEPIIRREIEQEYVKETIYEVRAEAPVMYQPSEYKPEPMKPLMLDRGTSPAVKYLRDAPTQASTATTDKSSQYDTPRPLDGMTQTQVYSVERGTTSDKICTSDVPVQAKPSMIHRGTTPTAKPNRESGVQVVVQKTDKGDQFEAKPSQSDVSVQFSHNPQTVGAPCQVQPETAEQGTLMEVPQIHQTYVQTENPLQRSENTQTITNQMDAVCQSEPVFYRDTTLQVKPVTFDKSTSTQPHETGDYSAQVELLDQHEFVEKIPVKQEDSSVQHEGSMDVTDRRIQARPVVREQANSPLSFLTFEIISPQSQGPVHVPPYPVRSQEAPIESTYIKEIVTGEKVQPVEYIPPRLTSPTTSDISSLKFTYSYSNRPSSTDHAKSPLEPQIARLDYVPLKSTDLYPFQPITSQTLSYMGSFDSKYESSSHFTREVLQSMPPRCEMILLQTTAAGTTYTSAFRTSTPTTHSLVPSTLHLSRMSIMEQVMPTESSTDGTSPIFSDTESDSLPELSELEKIRRDLRLSKVIVTDDQATLVGYFVNRDDETKTPDLPDSSPFSTPEYTQTSSRYEYTSRSTSNYTMQSPLRGRQHFMNLEHTPTESIPDVILDDSNDTFPAPIEESEWFKRETSAYRLNVPYDKKGSPRPGARIVHSLSPSQSPSHTPGRMSPVFLTSEHGHSMELLPIPRGMVTRLSDLLSDGIPSDDESVLPISRLSEMIEKHRELSQPPKWSAQSELPLTFKDPESEVDTTDSDTDTESFNAVMDFTDPFLHENPNFWQGGPTDFATSSTNSDVSSDDDVTVYGDCDVYSFDLPFFAPSKQTRPQRDASWMPGEPPRKRRSVIKIDRQRVREELSMSEVVLPDRPRLTGYRMSTDDSNWQRDRYNNRLSQSEPDLRRSTTSSEPFTTPPSYSTAYPYTKQQSSRIHPSPEHLMVDAGAMPALSAEIRYAKLVEKQEISHTHLSQYSRLSKSDPDLSAGQELFEFGHF